ncbi:MAG TPA: ATP-dependent DNA helicase [Dermatophilaceae bacterium]|nr:ATP-dependent DNA helicase [Dermatophilaceae bacterium]
MKLIVEPARVQPALEVQPAHELESELVVEPDLDALQKAAVQDRSPVLRVVGAPGTGKTTVALAAVLDRIRRDGMPASAGVVLTPSRRQAERLRDRLVSGAGVTTTRPMARTVASFAYAILSDHADSSGDGQPRLLTGADQDTILRELLAGHAADDGGPGRRPEWPAALAEAVPTRGFRDQLRDLISRAVEHGLEATDLALLGVTHEVPEWVAASRVLAEYDQVTALSRPGCFDPSWVLGAAAAALREDSASAARLAGRVRFVAVDDAQDLSPAAAQLIEAAVRVCGVRLLVAGDPDAAVHGFRGSDPRLVAGGWSLLADAPTVVLRRGHRQGSGLAAVTSRVAERVGSVGMVRHRRPVPRPDPRPASVLPVAADSAHVAGAASPAVEVSVLHSGGAQSRAVCSALRKAHVLQAVPWSQMAVLVRGQACGAALRRQLAAEGIPLVADAGLPLVEEPVVRPLLSLMSAAVAVAAGSADPFGVDALVDTLTSPVCGVDSLRLRAVRRAILRVDRSRGGQRSSDQLLVAGALGDSVAAALGELGDPLRRCAAAIRSGRRAMTGQVPATAHALLWAVWSALGVAEQWRQAALAGGPLGRAADRHLDAVVALFKAATDHQERLPGGGPGGFLELVMGQEVESDALVALAPATDAVTVTTPAGAAGRSWRLVVVAGVQQGQWPDLRPHGGLLHTQRLIDVLTGRDDRETGPDCAVLHDELRLFHVAVSRAREHLLVTAVRDEDHQPSVLLDLVDPPTPGQDEPRPFAVARPSASLPEAVAQLRREVVVAQEPVQRERAARGLALLAHHGVRGADPASWWSARDATDRDRPRRAGLTEVVISPSHLAGFTQCELRWFLTHCGGQPDHTSPASAVGQLVHDIAAGCDTGDEDAMGAELARRWPGLGLPAGWVTRRQFELAGDMVRRLAAHDRAAREQGWQLVSREVTLEATVGGVTVRGRVDRVERDDRGRVRVIDLKTGASKPSAADVARHPQLGAYQLLLAAHGPDPVAGAALLQLGGAATASRVDLQQQAPLEDGDAAGWAAAMVSDVGRRAAGSGFRAIPGTWCRTCPTVASCPSFADTGVDS